MPQGERGGILRNEAESELEACQTIRRRKIYRRTAALLPSNPQPKKKPDDSLVERRSECEGLPPHPFMGRRGRCPLLCHRSNLSDPMINCWKITCIKRPKTASTAAHRLRSSFRKFMFNNLMLSPRGLPRIFMMRH